MAGDNLMVSADKRTDRNDSASNGCEPDQAKVIDIVLPCFNETENVVPMHDAITCQFQTELPEYDYRIIFIDNYSTDGTRDKLRALCAVDFHTRAILNSRNFGQFNSPFYALLQADGDCAICMSCDFQTPVELIPRLVREWEKGHKVVCAIKTNSDENKILRGLRTAYYKLLKKMSDVEQIEHFNADGLYDRSFLNVLRELDDPQPFLRGIVAELGPANRKDVPYKQAKRRAGKTHNNFASLYDAAMLSFTSYTKAPLRVFTIAGAILCGLFLIAAIVYIVMWFCQALPYAPGLTPVIILVLLIGSVEIFAIGLVGEYILTINSRTLKRPLVIEEERLGDWGESG